MTPKQLVAAGQELAKHFHKGFVVVFSGQPRLNLRSLVCAMSNKKLQLVPSPAVVSGLSHEEEIRALQLADIVLHNPAETNMPALVGSRAKAGHRRLVEEVQGATKKVLGSKGAA